MSKPISPRLAALLSLVASGLGQFYAGRPRRAAGLFAFAFAATIAFPVSVAKLQSMAVFGAWLLFTLGFKIWVVRDAYVRARTAGEVPARYRAWYVLLPLFVVYQLATNVNDTMVKSYKLPTKSMEPTILEGDRVLVDKLVYGWFGLGGRDPLKGEIVVFTWPDDPRVPYMKRVAGVPGEPATMRDGREVNLGHDEYFLVGDAAESWDSRSKGPVTRDRFIGRAALVIWSYGSDGFRWDRSGVSF